MLELINRSLMKTLPNVAACLGDSSAAQRKHVVSEQHNSWLHVMHS